MAPERDSIPALSKRLWGFQLNYPVKTPLKRFNKQRGATAMQRGLVVRSSIISHWYK